MMTTIKKGDVVLIGGHLDGWKNCLMVVTEVATWGLKGSVYGYGDAEYPLRIGKHDIEAVYKKVEESYTGDLPGGRDNDRSNEKTD